MNKMYIAERFWRTVSLHIIKNLMTKGSINTPLVLGIHGPTGEGKTYQCEHVLQAMGVKSFLISGGQLESHEAGEPARLVRSTYIKAGKSVELGQCKAAAVLINDIDTGLGNWGDLVQYTINRQTVFGELMHIVDYPTVVENQKTKRIPIIITGNDFNKLYEPLVRAGRMTAFAWKPTLDEKSNMVSNIFSELDRSACEKLVGVLDSEVRRLLGHNDSLSIAFYAHLRSTLIDDSLWKEIERVGVGNAVSHIVTGHEPDLHSDVELNSLISAGKHLIQSGQLVNHLGRI